MALAQAAEMCDVVEGKEVTGCGYETGGRGRVRLSDCSGNEVTDVDSALLACVGLLPIWSPVGVLGLLGRVDLRVESSRVELSWHQQ